MSRPDPVFDQSDIARVMNRNKSTLSREMKRHRGDRGYRPKQAPEFSWARMCERENASPRWFNRFRKLLVRYEKTHRSYLALNMLAAAIICFRKVPGEINIIYG